MKSIATNLLLFVLVFMLSCAQTKNKQNAENVQQENKKLITHIYKMFETGDITMLEDIIHPDFIDHTQDQLIVQTGLEGLIELIRVNSTAFPELLVKVYNISAEGDMVYSHFNFSGKNTGMIHNSAPTQKFIDINGVDIIRVKDGKIIEHWGYWDTLKVLNQLGELEAVN